MTRPFNLFALWLLISIASCGGGSGAADPDAAADTDTDPGEECDCSVEGEVFCEDDCVKKRCDGCHYDVEDCCENNGDGSFGFCNPYALPYCDHMDVEPECLFVTDNYCEDDLTLAECQVHDDVWDNYYEMVDCSDPVSCPCGSGCQELDGFQGAQCWCCATDAGVPDGG